MLIESSSAPFSPAFTAAYWGVVSLLMGAGFTLAGAYVTAYRRKDIATTLAVIVSVFPVTLMVATGNGADIAASVEWAVGAIAGAVLVHLRSR